MNMKKENAWNHFVEKHPQKKFYYYQTTCHEKICTRFNDDNDSWRELEPHRVGTTTKSKCVEFAWIMAVHQ